MSWFKTPEQLTTEQELATKRQRIRELQTKLDNTDHKTFSDYTPKEGEDLQVVIAKRCEWRNEIRELLSTIPNTPSEA